MGMTRYFFDIHDTHGVWTDEEGRELTDTEAAQDEAALSLAGLAHDNLPGKRRHRIAVVVRTADGPLFEAAILFEVKALK